MTRPIPHIPPITARAVTETPYLDALLELDRAEAEGRDNDAREINARLDALEREFAE